jgi:23S rRNA pseudouridine955/2504/2580 synthase/23S rRNA pseudouridine1911/1915/1917 synthase
MLEVLFEDAHLIAVNKPAGLATIPGRGERQSVLERLAAQVGLPHSGATDPRLRVVHRLDKDTSGALLFAKSIESQRHLSHQFQNNRVEKEYLAIVAGRPTADDGEIDARLGPHPTRRDRMSVMKKGGRPARTSWKVEQRFRRHALLRVFPRTGKTHQIRVHLRHVGLPLVIDPLYNPPTEAGSPVGLLLSTFKRGYRAKRGEDERPLIDRLTLHAERLRFQLLSGERIEVVAPPPKDFRVALNMMRKYA